MACVLKCKLKLKILCYIPWKWYNYCESLFECKDVIIPLLLKIFNDIIACSIYPDALKVHKIISIPKENVINTVEKLRSIAVLTTIDNIFEKILYKQLSSFIENESLIFPNQYGFRKGCGTDEAAVVN